MKKIAMSCVPFALALCSQMVSAAAVMDRWGTATSTFAFECATQYCNDLDRGGPRGSRNDNAYHETISSSRVTDEENFNARAIAEIEHTGAIALPHLRGEVLSGRNLYTEASAYALEGFSYSGISQTVNLGIGLEGSILDPMPNNISDGTSIASSVYLFTDALALENTLAPNQVRLFGAALFDLASAEESLILNNSSEPTNGILADTATISFDLEDGDTFYIYATHQVMSSGPGIDCPTCPDFTSASSMNSLNLDLTTLSGDPVTGLTASSTVAAVPLPAAVWLMGSALMGLVGFRRRKTS